MKELETFYKNHQLRVMIKDEIPQVMAVSSFCEYGEANCQFECISGTECIKFIPNKTLERWQTKEDAVSADEVDWEKDSSPPVVKSDLELKIEELEARIQELESKQTTS